jgi:hypothetical protein
MIKPCRCIECDKEYPQELNGKDCDCEKRGLIVSMMIWELMKNLEIQSITSSEGKDNVFANGNG